ncbi:AI-2E family transporter [Humibacter ginsenosidimutans]|uniref:AI-2E family transporter n=1 Tax=Humibacter ginsenosidimutans TaxID=2599293 RepID=A0A5B8M240_9MICO|nr:AI-2E family transporter [Humibacter ginsenosidimutans]QDZ14423.1 AI-2E family transporter [Humibacter ginsenosidimutans]
MAKAPVPDREPTESVEDSVPRGVRVAAAWSWRLLLIGAVIAVVIYLIVQLQLIVVPVLVAVLLSALLVPLVELLTRRRWPRWLAIVVALVVVLVVVGGLVVLVVLQIRSEAHALQVRGMQAFSDFNAWLQAPPLQLTGSQIEGWLDQAFKALEQDSQVLVSGALSLGSTLGHVLTGALLTAFSTLFILIDGKGIWSWIVRIFPRRARAAADGAGHAGWTTLTSFARVQVLVASIDALGIGLVAFFLGLPLVIPIAVLVFLGSFIPIVGAVITGALAVVVALVYNGWVAAVIMLAGVLAVQQIEGHVLQPLIMGSAVKVHPLAVVLVVAAGSMLAGIPGALFAVPFAAVLNVMVKYVSSGAWRPDAAVAYTGPPDALWQTVPRPRRWRDRRAADAAATTHEAGEKDAGGQAPDHH